jgi:hypothetical protein
MQKITLHRYLSAKGGQWWLFLLKSVGGCGEDIVFIAV